MPILREDILNPIAGENPGGANLYYDPVMDKLREARREDDDAPAGDWEHERKTADHKLVIKLATETIATKSKDLQIAAWLTESLTKVHGFAGLKEGLDLLKGILENFWEGCYPEIEDGDLEMRCAPLDWVGARLEVPIKNVPILKNGYNFFQYKESRTVPSEGEAAGNEEKQKIRSEAVADNKITPEDWEIADKATTNDALIALAANLDGCLESLDGLDSVSSEKFDGQGPTYAPLRKVLHDEIRHTVKQFLKSRGVTDGPSEEEDAGGESDAANETAGAGMAVASGPRGLTVTGAIPASKEELPIRLEAIAKFMRQQNPADPGPYMMLRGLRWGELRGLGSNPDPRELVAPSTEGRMAVKRAFLNEDWAGCLEASEAVMAQPGGRAWLDVHRYAVKAAEKLGYDLLANAIKNDLRSLLADLPELPRWQLLDDSPTANAKTREWLEEIQGEQALAPRVVPETGPENAPPPKMDRDPFLVAKDFARSGQLQAALQLLNTQLQKETTGRGRFERKAQIATLLIDSSNDALAQNYVDECIAQIDSHKLEDWESAAWLAEYLAQIVAFLNRRETDWETRSRLYKIVARLDPAKALTCPVIA